MILVDLLRIIDNNNSLLSIKFGGNDETEFSLLFTRWTDTEYLFNFFLEHEADLERYAVSEAVFKVIEDAKQLEEFILDNAESGNTNFLTNFKPLHTNYDESNPFLKCKMYGLSTPSMLRIYGIKLANKSVIITGGAIKLTRTMQERAHTNVELIKLDQVRQYLINKGFTVDQIEFLDIEL